jgi:hypothetical protein
MLTTYLTEDEHADGLRKKRTDQRTMLDVMKAALNPNAALVIGGDPGCDVVPFRKAQPSPKPQQQPPPHRPAVPMRPAASGDDLAKIVAASKVAGTTLSKADLHTLRLEDGAAFAKYIDRKICERSPEVVAQIRKQARR